MVEREGRRRDEDPIRELNRLFQRAEEQMGRPFTPFPAIPWPFERTLFSQYHVSRSWIPRVDVVDQGNTILVRVELPGVDADDIHISLQDNVLVVHGEHQRKEESGDEFYYRRECSYGEFRREIVIPVDVSTEKVDAEHDNGVLTVTLWKTAV
jgi:HSP20 family protein